MSRPTKRRAAEPVLTTLQYLREQIKLSQHRLSQVSGVAQSCISDYENGLAMPVDRAGKLYRGIHTESDHEDRALVEQLTPNDLPRPWAVVSRSLYGRNNQHGNGHGEPLLVA